MLRTVYVKDHICWCFTFMWSFYRFYKITLNISLLRWYSVIFSCHRSYFPMILISVNRYSRNLPSVILLQLTWHDMTRHDMTGEHPIMSHFISSYFIFPIDATLSISNVLYSAPYYIVQQWTLYQIMIIFDLIVLDLLVTIFKGIIRHDFNYYY